MGCSVYIRLASLERKRISSDGVQRCLGGRLFLNFWSKTTGSGLTGTELKIILLPKCLSFLVWFFCCCFWSFFCFKYRIPGNTRDKNTNPSQVAEIIVPLMVGSTWPLQLFRAAMSSETQNPLSYFCTSLSLELEALITNLPRVNFQLPAAALLL